MIWAVCVEQDDQIQIKLFTINHRCTDEDAKEMIERVEKKPIIAVKEVKNTDAIMIVDDEIRSNDIEFANNFIKTVALSFGMELSKLLINRKRRYVDVRKIMFALIRQYTTLSLQDIASLFGNKHHSTILYALDSYKSLMNIDDNFRMMNDACLEILLIEINKENEGTISEDPNSEG